MRIVVHAGLHKTGTTSFQYACRQATEQLTRQGVLYPCSVSDAKFPASHADIAQLAADGRVSVLESYFRTCRSEAEKKGARTVLLSSEKFSSLSLNRDRLKTFDQVLQNTFVGATYILVLREMETLLRSTFLQLLSHDGFSFASPVCYREGTNIVNYLFSMVKQFQNTLGHRLSLLSFENLIADGPHLCSNLLSACCPEEMNNNSYILPELRLNTSRDSTDSFFVSNILVAPLRGALSIKKHDHPYSPDITSSLNELIDRKAVEASLPNASRIADLFREALDKVVEKVTETNRGQLRNVDSRIFALFYPEA